MPHEPLFYEPGHKAMAWTLKDYQTLNDDQTLLYYQNMM